MCAQEHLDVTIATQQPGSSCDQGHQSSVGQTVRKTKPNEGGSAPEREGNQRERTGKEREAQPGQPSVKLISLPLATSCLCQVACLTLKVGDICQQILPKRFVDRPEPLSFLCPMMQAGWRSSLQQNTSGEFGGSNMMFHMCLAQS